MQVQVLLFWLQFGGELQRGTRGGAGAEKAGLGASYTFFLKYFLENEIFLENRIFLENLKFFVPIFYENDCIFFKNPISFFFASELDSESLSTLDETKCQKSEKI